jgi:hypothetical protein
MQSEVMDCHVADAPRNDGHFRNDESNSRHCEAEGRGNPRSQKSWIATSLTLLAMTATFAMTGLFMGSPSMNSGQAKARQSRSSFPALAAKGFAVGETLLADNTLVSGQTGATHAD